MTKDWESLRVTRNRLLRDTDWCDLVNHKLSIQQKTEIDAYRQALRDLPANTVDPVESKFPTIPNFLENSD